MAILLNGTNQYIDGGALTISTRPYTIHCVFRPTSTGTQQSMFALSTKTSPINSVTFRTDGTMKLMFILNVQPNSYSYTSTYTVPTNAYTIVTAVVTLTQILLYANGVLRLTQSHTAFGTMTNVSFGAIFQGSATPSTFFPGNVSEGALWNVQLSDAEIASLGAGFSADQIRPQSLLFYAPLVRDLIELRNNQTLNPVNSPTVSVHPRIIT